ncbi:uncharacterized protein AruCF_0164 [Achromobacter ruhlandii]|nr:uncharacterized protein AruCF_0164 [Achromobacter ruhlandii]
MFRDPGIDEARTERLLQRFQGHESQIACQENHIWIRGTRD